MVKESFQVGWSLTHGWREYIATSIWHNFSIIHTKFVKSTILLTYSKKLWLDQRLVWSTYFATVIAIPQSYQVSQNLNIVSKWLWKDRYAWTKIWVKALLTATLLELSPFVDIVNFYAQVRSLCFRSPYNLLPSTYYSSIAMVWTRQNASWARY